MITTQDVKNKKARLRRNLLAWFDRTRRDLPWRRTRDPYHVWLSEVILQQTRVGQGTPYFERFLRAFPTVDSLAAASPRAVLKQWEGLGYYARARNLHRAAKLIVHERNGAFPESAADWQSLPGVGRYTAGAVASIVYDEPAPVVDGNVKRVLARLFAIQEIVESAPVEKLLWEITGFLVKGRRPGDFNQAMMELGAEVCTPRNPLCDMCPVRNVCNARAGNMQHELPRRKPKKATPRHEFVAAAIKKNGQYLFVQRPQRGLLGGMWELPSGEVLAGETHHQALERVLRDDFGLRVEPKGLLAAVDHAYSHFKVTLTVYACVKVRGRIRPVAHDATAWLAPGEFADHPLPKTHLKFVDLLV